MTSAGFGGGMWRQNVTEIRLGIVAKSDLVGRVSGQKMVSEK